MSEAEDDPFVLLLDTLDADLKARGFNPSSSPPGEEPRIRGKLSKKTDIELSNMYDEFLEYFDYLSEDLTDLGVKHGVTKERLAKVRAAAAAEAVQHAGLKTQEARKNWVIVHPDVVQVTVDFQYFEQLVKAQTERSRRISKSMDRIWRELMSRKERTGRTREPPRGGRSNRYTPDNYERSENNDEQQHRPRPFNRPKRS